MHYPSLLSRVGAVSGLIRLIAFALEVISFILLAVRHSPDYDWTTSYLIVSLVWYLPWLNVETDLFVAFVPHLCGLIRDRMPVWTGPRMATLTVASLGCG